MLGIRALQPPSGSIALRLVVMMQEMSSGERDNPKADDQGTHGQNPAPRGAVMSGKAGRFAGAENLAADADGHQKCAEDKGGPRHGLTFVPYPRWMREGERARSEGVRFWM